MTTIPKPVDQFDDVPDLTDVQRDHDSTRAPTLKESVREITHLLKRKAHEDTDVSPASMATVQVVIEAYVELIMREAVRTGNVRLPQGWGTLKLQHIKGSKTPRTVPNVGHVPRKPSVKVKYVSGVTMDDLLQRQQAIAYASGRAQRTYYFPEKEVRTAEDLAANTPVE